MAKNKQPAPPIRKSFLIIGGVAIGAALLGFILMTFVLGGGGGSDEPESPSEVATEQGGTAGGSAGGAAPAATPAPTPAPQVENEIKEGGRDPFAPLAAGAAAAPAAEVAPVVEEIDLEVNADGSEVVEVEVLDTYSDAADLKLNGQTFEGLDQGEVISPRFDMDEITGDCVWMKDSGARFKVCVGEMVKR